MRKKINKIKMIGQLILLLMLIPVLNSYGSSFACEKATTKVEKMICANAELSKLDEDLNYYYNKALKVTNEVKYLQQQQRDWLVTVRNRCVDEGELRNQYYLQTKLLSDVKWLDNKPVKDIDCLETNTPFGQYFCHRTVITYQGNENEYSYDEEFEGPSASLSDYDQKLQTAYAEALKKHFDPVLLHKEQLAWLRQREICVLDDNCVSPVGLYEDRIYNLRYAIEHPPQEEKEKKLARVVSMGTPPGNNFVIAVGKSTLCHALVRWLNYTTPKGDFGKGYQMIKDMPGITFPAWQELNIDQHKGLFLDILDSSNDPLLYGRQPKVTYEEARAKGERLWMVKAKIDYQPDNRKQTIVWHRIPYMKSKTGSEIVYGDDPYLYGSGRLWIVYDDLSGVDSEQSRYIGQRSADMFLYFNEIPFFLSAYSRHAFIYNPTCEINNFLSERHEQ